MFTALAIGTEAGQIIFAQNSSHMSMTAIWPVPTEASIVPGTIFDLRLGIDVQKGALLFVACVEA